MMGYASRTGTRQNLTALRNAGWGLLVSRAGAWRTEGFSDWIADNGAWTDFIAAREFDGERFELFLEWVETQAICPRFIVLLDIVAGGLKSLDLSRRYMNRCGAICPLILIAVQDGMETEDLAPLVGPSVGIFLGGSTEWKLAQMSLWGRFCAERGIYYHVARVNTLRRIRMAHAAGAHSIDGTSASRYAVTLPMLDRGIRQPDLFSPRATQ
jgi:hypothetical protein